MQLENLPLLLFKFWGEYMPVDYHIHSVAHGERSITFSELKPFVEKARKLGLKEIGFADHDWCLDKINFKEYFAIKKHYSDIKIRLGLELEYFPDKEAEIKKTIEKYNLDYTIGSVHFLGDWNFDHPDYMEEYKNWTLEKLYKCYYETLYKCASSGLFNILGHLDLIKVFNKKMDMNKTIELVEPVLKEVKNQNMALEINAAGLYKPIKEIYPAIELIKIAVDMGIPFTISSDAHNAKDVGRNNKMIVEILKSMNVFKVACFKK